MKNKLFRMYLLTFLLLIISLMFGCTYQYEVNNSESLTKLNKVTYPSNSYEPKSLDSKMIETLNKFTIKTSNAFFNKEKNNIYSPISLYMCFSLLTEGAEDETLDELMSFLETQNLDDLRQNVKIAYCNNYYKNDSGEAKMANSVWISKDITVKAPYINTLTQDYYTDIYNVLFNKETNQTIVDWINFQTKDLLDLTVDKFPVDDDLAMLLLNTIYFDNKWKTEFKSEQTVDDIFHGKENVTIKFMTHQTQSLYYKTESYEYVEDYFNNDNKIIYILPNENVDLYSLLTEEILTAPKKQEPYTAKITVPKFKYYSDFDLVESIKALGVTQIFDSVNAKLKKISDLDLYVSSVKQNAGIELNEEGVKAAAVSSIGVKNESVSMSEYVNIKLDRPFIYIIKDSNNVPLFIGTVINPQEK